jgi:hypothetical protein
VWGRHFVFGMGQTFCFWYGTDITGEGQAWPSSKRYQETLLIIARFSIALCASLNRDQINLWDGCYQSVQKLCFPLFFMNM